MKTDLENIQSLLDRFKRPIVSYEKNETGLYRKYFQLPNEWNVEDRYVTILFHAIGPACRFYVNNVYIGMSKDSFTGTEFDISFADLTSPEIGSIFEHPQLTVLPVSDSTSFPQERHLTLIDSIFSNYQLLYMLLLYIRFLSVCRLLHLLHTFYN